ncbi:MAG: PaaI family thioesterase [Chloroflexi bacterium]|nr:PaaI family thioesterase [Chloroflexota bacterium]
MDKQPSSRTCFVCGRQNPVGLKVTWYNDHEAQRVWATVTIPEHFNGYPGIVHGGIIATLLDETAGRSLLLDGDDSNLMVTLKLEIKYRKPVPTGQPVTLQGWAIQRTANRARVAANLLLPDGTLAAEAEAILVRPPQEFFERWEPEKPFWRVYDD